MSAKKLENLLGPGSGGSLEKLIQTARDMDALTGAVRGALSPDMGENVVAANVRENGELVIICASPAWASRIRFEADALLAAAAEAGFTAGSLRVAVSQS
jgi:hypothetical protein